MSVATAFPPPAAAPAPAGVDAASARRGGRRQGNEQGSFGAVLASHTSGSGSSKPAVPATAKHGAQDRPTGQDDPSDNLPESPGCLAVGVAPVVPEPTSTATAAAAAAAALTPRMLDATTSSSQDVAATAAAGTPATAVTGPASVGAAPVAEMSHQKALAGTVPSPAPGTAGHDVVKLTAVKPTAANPTAAKPTAANPTAANPTAAKPTAANATAAEPKAEEPKAAGPKAAGSETANHDVAAVPGTHDVANDAANRKAAVDEAATPPAPDHLGKNVAPASSAAADTTAPALPVAAGADPVTAGPSVPAATVHPGQVAPTTGVPAPAGAPAPAPAPAAVPVPVQQQVFAAVGPLLRADDGSYAVQLQLHPHDLGAVQVTVDVRHGEISVQLHSPDPAAQDALRDGLSDLRRQLEDQGLRTGSMEVGSGGADPRQRDGTRPQPFAVRVAASGAPLAGTGPLVPTPAGSTALDLRM